MQYCFAIVGVVINELKKILQGVYVVMSNGTHVYISKNKKEVLLKKLLPYKE